MDAPRKFNPEELARIKDSAVVEAHRLRQEAIDDFWRGANDIMSTAAIQSYRSAQRLASRLKRRVRNEAAPASQASAE